MKSLKKPGFFHELSKNKVLYLMFLPVAVYYILFAYVPMLGIVVALRILTTEMESYSVLGMVLIISDTFLYRGKPYRSQLIQ
jgi:ABC-type polysaccharide transport system permease subunit